MLREILFSLEISPLKDRVIMFLWCKKNSRIYKIPFIDYLSYKCMYVYIHMYNFINLKGNKWTKKKQNLKPEFYNLIAQNAEKKNVKYKKNKIICK